MKRVSKEVTRGPDFLGLMFRGINFEMQSIVDDIFSMREKIEVKAFAPPSNLVHGGYYFTYDM